MAGSKKGINQLPLRARVTCPHCWHRFQPGEILWVSVHPGLQGDTLLGDGEQQRFLPTRFTVKGLAIDVKGETCKTLACPNCHLVIPRILLETESLFLSIIGSPSSGKSYFLAAMTWQSRKALSQMFGVSLIDPDPDVNRILNSYETTLFFGGDPNGLVRLEKTQKEGQLYNSVKRGDRQFWYPHPFVFSVGPKDIHRDDDKQHGLLRALCLYDNAGEHFLPGGGDDAGTVTNHLSLSRALFFLFDPIQHPRFREACTRFSSDPQLTGSTPFHRQDQVLLEASKRIRSQTGLAQHEKSPQPLIVVMTKYDVWAGLLGDQQLAHDWALSADEASKPALDVAAVLEVSNRMRSLLLEHAPEMIEAAEGLSREVVFIPVSALGTSPETNPDGYFAIRAKDIQPHGVEVPLIYALYRTLGALIPTLKRRGRRSLWDMMPVRAEEHVSDVVKPQASDVVKPQAAPLAAPLKPAVPAAASAVSAASAASVPPLHEVPLRAVREHEQPVDIPKSIPLKETGS